MSTSHLPSGYQTVTPYLVVEDPAILVGFLTRAWDGTVRERIEDGSGGIRHAEVQVGTSMLMMGAAGGESAPIQSMLYLYVPSVDDWYTRALAAGAESIQEVQDQPYGDRTAAVRGPAGNRWYLAQRMEDLSSEEIARRLGADQDRNAAAAGS